MTDPVSYTGPIWIPGRPIPKGSMRCVTPHIDGRRGILKGDPQLEPWESKIAQFVGWNAAPLVRDPLQGPCELTIDFEIKKPARPRYADAPIGHGKGDLDKLTRTIGDALTAAAVYKDDALVTRIIAEKIYSPTGREGVTVELRPYTPPPPSPRGRLPVRLQAGRINSLIGSIDDIRGLPNLLRQVADQLERSGHAIT